MSPILTLPSLIKISQESQNKLISLDFDTGDHGNKNIDENLNINNTKLKFSHEEIKVFRKITEWPKCVELSIKKLEPHRIPTYLYELASLFHSYWNLGKENPEKRFINENQVIFGNNLIALHSLKDKFADKIQTI